MAGDEQIGRLLVLLEAQTAKMDEQITQSTQRMLGFKGAVDLAKDALAAFGLMEVFKGVIDATAASEKAQALLESQVKATGEAAGFTSQQLEAMAHGFQDTTTTSATQIEQLQGQLMAFRNIAGDQFKAVIQAALDFSAVTGRDATSAVKSLGMALNDPITGMQKLSREGIELDASTKAAIKSLTEQGDLLGAQKVLLDEMTRSYGGAAAAARDTLGGALQSLKNDMNEVLEGHGGSVTAITSAVKDMDATLKDPEVQQGLANLVSGLLRFAAAAGELLAGLGKIPEALAEAVAHAQGYAGNFDDQIKSWQDKITSTQQLLDQLKMDQSGNSDPAIKKLTSDLNDYKIQLQQVMVLQSNVITAKPAASAGAGVPDLYSLFPNDFKPTKNIDEVQNLNPDVNGKLLTSYEQLIADQKQVVAIWKENDPALELQRQIDKTNELVNTQVNGILFTADDAQKHIASLQLAYDKQNDAMVSSAQAAAQGIQGAFSDFLMHPFQEGLAGMAKAFEEMLLRMVAQAEAASIIKSIFGGSDTTGNNSGTTGLGMILSSVFGGHRAGGGPVSAGMLYQVNEGTAGKEGFLPSNSGTVVPLGAGSQGGSGGDINIHYSINAQGADGETAARLLQFAPYFRRQIHSDVEQFAQRGVWPS